MPRLISWAPALGISERSRGCWGRAGEIEARAAAGGWRSTRGEGSSGGRSGSETSYAHQCPFAQPEAQVCVGDMCEDNECGEDAGQPIGICAAANMVCDQNTSDCVGFNVTSTQCWPTTDGQAPMGCSHGGDWRIIEP